MEIERGQLFGMVVLCALLVLAGCEGDGGWHLEIHDLEISSNGSSQRMTGEVELGGFMSEVRVEEARLVLTTANTSVVDRIYVGDLDGNSTRRVVPFEERLDTVPKCVLIEYDSIEAPSHQEGEVWEYVHTGDGYWGFGRPPSEPFESCQTLMDEYREINAAT